MYKISSCDLKLTGNNGQFSKHFYYKHRVEAEVYSATPRGTLDINRALQLEEKIWKEQNHTEILKPKTLVLMDWEWAALHELSKDTSYEAVVALEERKNKLRALLSTETPFKIFIWQDGTVKQLTLESFELLDSRAVQRDMFPCHQKVVFDVMAREEGTPAQQIAILDPYALDHIYDDSIASKYVISLSKLRFNFFYQILEYLKSLNISIVINVDVLSLESYSLRLHPEKDVDYLELKKFAPITYLYKNIELSSELFDRISENSTMELDFSQVTSIWYDFQVELRECDIDLVHKIISGGNIISKIELSEDMFENVSYFTNEVLPHLNKIKFLKILKVTISSDLLISIFKTCTELTELELDSFSCTDENNVPDSMLPKNLERLRVSVLEGDNLSAGFVNRLMNCNGSLKSAYISGAIVSEYCYLKQKINHNLKQLIIRSYLSNSAVPASAMLSILLRYPNLESLNTDVHINVSMDNIFGKFIFNKLKKLTVSEKELSHKSSQRSVIDATLDCRLLDNFPNLEYLNAGEKIGKYFINPSEIQSRLKCLRLIACNIEKKEIEGLIEKIPNVEQMNLRLAYNMSNPIGSSVSKLEKLTDLAFDYTKIGENPVIELLDVCPLLKSLYIGNDSVITDDIKLGTKKYPAMKRLAVPMVRDDFNAKALGKLIQAMPNLTTLMLYGIKDDTLDNLYQSKHLLKNIKDIYLVGLIISKPSLVKLISLIANMRYVIIDSLIVKDVKVDELVQILESNNVNPKIKSTMIGGYYDPDYQYVTDDISDDDSTEVDRSVNPSDEMLHKALNPSRPENFNYSQEKNKQLSQAMVTNQLCQYMTLKKMSSDAIMRVNDGICYYLSKRFTEESTDQYLQWLKHLQKWDGKLKNLSPKIEKSFKILLTEIFNQSLCPKSYYVGDALELFIASWQSHDAMILENPWHAIAVKKEINTAGHYDYYIYDPNNEKAFEKISKANLPNKIRTRIGSIILTYQSNDYPVQDKIKDVSNFFNSGGSLLFPEYPEFFGLLERHLHSIKDINVLKDGLMITSVGAIPAWLLCLINKESNKFFEKMMALFINQNQTGFRDEFQKSLSGLSSNDQKMFMSLIDTYLNSSDDEMKESLKSSRQRVMELMTPIELNPQESELMETDDETYFETGDETDDKTDDEIVEAYSEEETEELEYTHYFSNDLSSTEEEKSIVVALESSQKHLLICSNEHTAIEVLSKLYAHAKSRQALSFWAHRPADLLCQLPLIERDEYNNGVIKQGPAGPFYDFLHSAANTGKQALLLVDASTFEASDIASQLNAMLDETREADGTPIPPNVKIVVIQDRTSQYFYDGEDLRSRFDEIDTIDAANDLSIPKHDDETLDTDNMSIDSSGQSIQLDLYSANWRAEMIGYWKVKGTELYYMQGKLVNALAAGAEQIVILGNPISRSFKCYLERASIDGDIDGYAFNQSMLEFSSHDEVVKPAITLLSADEWAERRRDESPFILNPSTVTELYKRFDHNDEDQTITFKEGLLEARKGRNEPLKLYLSRDLTQPQWLELVKTSEQLGVTLTLYALPNVFSEQNHSEVRQHSCMIASTDPDATARIKKGNSDDIIILDITELEVGEIFESLSLVKGSHLFNFTKQQKFLHRWLAEVSSHQCILLGQISPEKVDQLLPYLYQYDGRLKIIIDIETAAYFPDSYERHEPTKEDKFSQLISAFPHLSNQGEDLFVASRDLLAMPLVNSFALCRYQLINVANQLNSTQWDGLYKITYTPQANNLELPKVYSSDCTQRTEQYLEGHKARIDKAFSVSPILIVSGRTGTGKSTFIMEHIMVNQPKTFEEWIRNGGIWFIDEANICQSAYSKYEGLFQDKPYIIHNDKIHYLSKTHKVLFAINPLSDGGSRQDIRLFQRHAYTIIFDPMPVMVLFELVVKPLFTGLGIQDEQVYQSTYELLNVYQFVLRHTDDKLIITPRDIKAVVMRSIALTYTNLGLININAFKEQLLKQLNVIIRPKMSNVLQTRVDNPIKPCVTQSLEQPKEPYKIDNFVVTSSRFELVDTLQTSLELRRFRRANQSVLQPCQLIGDLSAIVIEGEPGVGKTELFKALLNAANFRKNDIKSNLNHLSLADDVYYHLPVVAPLKLKKLVLLKAYFEGAIVIIDERNTVPMLEQFCNNLLMGHIPLDDDIKDSPLLTSDITARPGFTIWGSQNSIKCMGRMQDTAAQLARCIKLDMTALKSVAELQSVLRLNFPNLSDEQSQKLIKAYLSECAKAERDPARALPNFRNFIRAAADLSLQQSTSPSRKQQLGVNPYQFYEPKQKSRNAEESQDEPLSKRMKIQ